MKVVMVTLTHVIAKADKLFSSVPELTGEGLLERCCLGGGG
jgi:hypothetical protein